MITDSLTSPTSPALRPLGSRGRLPLRGLGLLPDGRGGRPVEPIAEIVGADARHDLVVLDGRGHALRARHDRPRHAVERGTIRLSFSGSVHCGQVGDTTRCQYDTSKTDSFHFEFFS